jgi:uncharacterized membrane protein
VKSFLIILLAGAVAALTIVIRVPIPGTGGYLNFGDVGVVFCGLFLGRRWGALAGGLGSALADLIGGFFIFIPITLIAKGLEGYLAGLIGKGKLHFSFLILAGVAMMAVYFAAELFVPGMGFGAAVSELPFNALQAVVGAFGGFGVYLAVTKALPEKDSEKMH